MPCGRLSSEAATPRSTGFCEPETPSQLQDVHEGENHLPPHLGFCYFGSQFFATDPT